MYDELIKRLRAATTLPVMNALCQEAANAIKELSKKKDCPCWFEDGGFCSMLGKCIAEPPKEEEK